MNQVSPSLQHLPVKDLQKVGHALPIEVKEVLISFPQLFVAGGAIRAILADEPIKDIDIFTTNLDVIPLAVPRYIQGFCPWGDWKELLTPCTRTITVEGFPPVQFINNVAYDSPEHIINQVDFTICQAAVWHDVDGWHSLCTPEFIRDVADKRLVYTAPNRVEAPGGSLWRAFKYAQRGYTITQSELAKLVMRLNAGLDNGVIEVNPWTHVTRKTHEVDAIRSSFALRAGASY